jgi:hypothetical protein
MYWKPFILGFVDDPYSRNVWVVLLIGAIGFGLCYFRYKLAWAILPIILLTSFYFLLGLLEPTNYNHISTLVPTLIPRAILLILISMVLPIVGAFLNWRKSKINRIELK